MTEEPQIVSAAATSFGRMNAVKTLDAAANHLRDRAATYDSPGGERSAGKAAAAFNAITGRDLTAGDVYLLLAVLKAVRARQGSFKSDNYEDGAAYFALMGEADASTIPVSVEISPPTN